MGDIVNPYANPYLPSFVNQRPRMNDGPKVTMPSPQINLGGMAYGQIHSVKGFDGARAYNLANGASEILAEEDPNLARIYVVAKDANGQSFVQGFDLVSIEEPKPVTMDDLSSTMNQILERLNKLEENKNDQSYHGSSWKSPKQSVHAGNQPDARSSQNGSEPTGNGSTNGSK